jgi:hypothetical protein
MLLRDNSRPHSVAFAKLRFVFSCARQAKHLLLWNIVGFSRRWLWRMPSSGMWHRVALVRNDVSEERTASIFKVTRIGELGTTLAVSSNRSRLRRNSMCQYFLTACVCYYLLLTFLAQRFLSPWWWKHYVPPKRRFLTRATRSNIQEDGILHLLLLASKVLRHFREKE